jgi:hypothetical protein
MTETIRLGGIDVALTVDSITALLAEKKRQYQEQAGRLDAMGQELKKERQVREALEDPKIIEAKLQSRLKLVEQYRAILGNDISLEGKSNAELKLAGLKLRSSFDVVFRLMVHEQQMASNVGYFESVALSENL